MNYSIHNSITNFIWNIADDVLRDVYVRGKYRDTIFGATYQSTDQVGTGAR